MLEHLEGLHPDAGRVERLLGSFGFAGDVNVGSLPAGFQPFLVARIRTARGVKVLDPR